jgi:mRNA interferase RelE/StbE
VSDPRFGLTVDPRVVSDLMIAPDPIRAEAMNRLAAVLEGQPEGDELVGVLSGFRSISLDPRWRLVYTVRPAPQASLYQREVFVAAVRPRARFDVYGTVAARLGLNVRPVSALAHAARSRSPQTSHANRLYALPTPSSLPTAKGPSR